MTISHAHVWYRKSLCKAKENQRKRERMRKKERKERKKIVKFGL